MQQHRVETKILHEEQILEAIDQLRRRKARPDADRICNYLLRKFAVDARDTIADLHRLIEAEKVIQVDYKGNTSYRNASKWSRLQLYKNRPEGFVKEKLNSSMIAGAVAELVVEEPDYLDQGVPAYRLVEQLLDGISNPTSRRMVEDFLSKEVSSGNIARLSNGNYSLVATTDVTPTTSPTSVIETNATTSIADTTSSVTSMSNSNNSTLSASAHQQNNNNNNNNNHLRNNNNNNNNHQINNTNNNNNIGEPEEDTTRNSANNRLSANPNSAKLSYSAVPTTTPIIVATPPIITTTTISIPTSVRSQETTSTTSLTSIKSKSPELLLSRGLYDFEDNEDDVMVTDSRSNTPRSSQGNSSPPRQLVNEQNILNDIPRNKNVNKEECYEITIIGKEPDSPEESVTKDDLESREQDSMNSNNDTRIKNQHTTKQTKDNNHSNLKKTSKSERKQRLLVRSEDPMDIEIKFEDFGRDTKDDRDKQQSRDLDNAQHSDDRDDDDYAGRSSTNPSPTPSNTTVAAFRSARRKRAKKVFDPSDNNVVKRKRGRPVSQNKIQGSQESQEPKKPMAKEGPNRQCSLCAKEKSESLVACRDCTVRAHPTCIYPPDELVQKSGSSWQCELCKSCTVCCETSDVGPLVTCYICDEAYHYSCHVPRIPSAKSNSKWQCNDCSQKNYKTNVVQSSNSSVSRPETPSNAAVLPPVLSPQVSPNRGSPDQMEDEGGAREGGIDPNIPDASDWTSEQVYQYFARLFPKEAEVFRVQDIDGHSLLLMKRSDVLSGLDLLLGPALKIYRHVLKLQMRRDDPRLYWL